MRNISRLAINDEGFIFDPASGDSFQVSQTGLFILGAMKAGKVDAEIAQALTEKYQVALEETQRDLADFRASLKCFGLV